MEIMDDDEEDVVEVIEVIEVIEITVTEVGCQQEFAGDALQTTYTKTNLRLWFSIARRVVKSTSIGSQIELAAAPVFPEECPKEEQECY